MTLNVKAERFLGIRTGTGKPGGKVCCAPVASSSKITSRFESVMRAMKLGTSTLKRHTKPISFFPLPIPGRMTQ